MQHWQATSPTDIESHARPFPFSTDIETWAHARGTCVEDAERRFFHYAAICSIALDPELNQDLILRGSGAMWLAYGHVRPSAADLDFISRRLDGERAPPVTQSTASGTAGTRYNRSEDARVDARRQLLEARSGSVGAGRSHLSRRRAK